MYHGDCVRVMSRMPRESVDVVVTSPPYNIGLQYGTYKDRRAEEEYLDWMVAVATGIKRVMRPDASFFLNITGSSVMPWLPFELLVRLRPLFRLQNHITWIKSISIGDDSVGHFKPIRSDRFLHRNHEHIFHLTGTGNVPLKRLSVGVPFKDKTNISRRNHAQDLRCRGDSWFIPYETVHDRSQKFHHPGTFPVMLPRMCIRLHGVHAPVVLDPFMGTGTTLLAADAEGGRGLGIDLDPRYVAIARQRLQGARKAARAAAG
ncbi:site-specific DNA-methyltransferase [Acetobacteraceae bacterium KSS12]|uniref:Methyltransferase n=2 Tax=Rhizosaccharibacter radicis TaxID=2782605 RepID=A0ABT1VVR3_9PROT|nr:site-specific DNA-methyltransferase [Acetobacteraceae bacterium KSS12]